MNAAQLPFDFDGKTYVPKRDKKRLNEQYQRVFNLMQDGQWRTLQEIEDATGDPQSSIGARMRDFRKPKFGAHTVDRKYCGEGLFAYRLIKNMKA